MSEPAALINGIRGLFLLHPEKTMDLRDMPAIYKEPVFRWFKIIAASVLIVLAALPLIALILEHGKKTAPYAPLLSEAKELDLDFDQAVKDPDKYIGKPVVWCVQNRSKNEVFYRGDLNRRITVFNHEQMPLVPGSKHSSCSPMLLQIKGVRKTLSGSGIAGVMFITEP